MGRSPSLDERHMRRCLELARRGAGRTSPNPMVGAVVARGGRVIAEAWHRRAGGPHAEAAALSTAGRSARGATLYVNLEPCCHHGRTPPCVDAILASGIRRVVTSHRDPFLLVRGRGLAKLRSGGLRVDVGLMASDARRLNERYLRFVTRGTPFVLVKAAMSLDGQIATRTGESRWITSPRARAVAHRLREEYDAVMIGAGTALADNPRLTARPRGRRPARQPVRVVVDGRLRLPAAARLLARSAGAGPVIIYTTPGAPAPRERQLARRGARIVRIGRRGAARVDLREALSDLGRRGVGSVMIEGGSGLIGAAFDRRLVDKVALFIAPILIGGHGLKVAGGRGAKRLRDAVRLEGITVTRVGPDWLVEGYPAVRADGSV